MSTRNTKLLISGLGSGVQQKDIFDLFSRHGKILGCSIKNNFAFVEYSHPDDAEDAIRSLDGYTYHGKKLVVQKLKAKQSSPVRDQLSPFSRTRIYVGGLTEGINIRELEEVFSEVGHVVRTVDKKSFAFLEYESSIHAEKAIKRFNGTDFAGRRLIVNFATIPFHHGRGGSHHSPRRGRSRSLSRSPSRGRKRMRYSSVSRSRSRSPSRSPGRYSRSRSRSRGRGWDYSSRDRRRGRSRSPGGRDYSPYYSRSSSSDSSRSRSRSYSRSRSRTPSKSPGSSSSSSHDSPALKPNGTHKTETPQLIPSSTVPTDSTPQDPTLLPTITSSPSDTTTPPLIPDVATPTSVVSPLLTSAPIQLPYTTTQLDSPNPSLPQEALETHIKTESPPSMEPSTPPLVQSPQDGQKWESVTSPVFPTKSASGLFAIPPQPPSNLSALLPTPPISAAFPHMAPIASSLAPLTSNVILAIPSAPSALVQSIPSPVFVATPPLPTTLSTQPVLSSTAPPLTVSAEVEQRPANFDTEKEKEKEKEKDKDKEKEREKDKEVDNKERDRDYRDRDYRDRERDRDRDRDYRDRDRDRDRDYGRRRYTDRRDYHSSSSYGKDKEAESEDVPLKEEKAGAIDSVTSTTSLSSSLSTPVASSNKDLDQVLSNLFKTRDAMLKGIDGVFAELQRRNQLFTQLISREEGRNKEIDGLRAELINVKKDLVTKNEMGCRRIEREMERRLGLLEGKLIKTPQEEEAARKMTQEAVQAALNNTLGPIAASIEATFKMIAETRNEQQALKGELRLVLDAMRADVHGSREAVLAKVDMGMSDLRVPLGQLAANEAQNARQIDSLRQQLAALQQQVAGVAQAQQSQPQPQEPAPAPFAGAFGKKMFPIEALTSKIFSIDQKIETLETSLSRQFADLKNEFLTQQAIKGMISEDKKNAARITRKKGTM